MSEKSGIEITTHVIPLKRVYFGRKANRADRAVRLIRKYIERHYKEAEKVIIHPLVNKYIWSCGREKPPRRILVEVRFDKKSKTARVFLTKHGKQ